MMMPIRRGPGCKRRRLLTTLLFRGLRAVLVLVLVAVAGAAAAHRGAKQPEAQQQRPALPHHLSCLRKWKEPAAGRRGWLLWFSTSEKRSYDVFVFSTEV